MIGPAAAQSACDTVSFTAGTQWSLCWELRKNEGLVINTANYTAGEEGRSTERSRSDKSSRTRSRFCAYDIATFGIRGMSGKAISGCPDFRIDATKIDDVTFCAAHLLRGLMLAATSGCRCRRAKARAGRVKISAAVAGSSMQYRRRAKPEHHEFELLILRNHTAACRKQQTAVRGLVAAEEKAAVSL